MIAVFRQIIGMGLAWLLGWTLIGMLGVVIFYTLFPSTPDFFDIWIPVFAYPGFFGGVVFSLIARLAEKERPLATLPSGRVAGHGSIAGLIVGSLPFVLGTPGAQYPLWLLVVVIVGSVTVLCTISAVVTAFVAWRLAIRNR